MLSNPPALTVCSFLSPAVCVALVLLNLCTFHEERVSGHAELQLNVSPGRSTGGVFWVVGFSPCHPDWSPWSAGRLRLSSGSGCFSKLELWPTQLTGLHMCLLENHVCAHPQAHAVRTSWQVRFWILHCNLFLRALICSGVNVKDLQAGRPVMPPAHMDGERSGVKEA